MANPILSQFSQSPQQQIQQQPNTLLDMFNAVKASSNPNQAMQQMLSSNPQFQNVMGYINQNGGDARTAFYNMAAQMGVDPNTVLNHPLLKQLK